MNLNLVFFTVNEFEFEFRNSKQNEWIQPVPSLRGDKRGRTPVTAACAPILVTKNTDFETSRNKTTDNDGKRNNYV